MITFDATKYREGDSAFFAQINSSLMTISRFIPIHSLIYTRKYVGFWKYFRILFDSIRSYEQVYHRSMMLDPLYRNVHSQVCVFAHNNSTDKIYPAIRATLMSQFHYGVGNILNSHRDILSQCPSGNGNVPHIVIVFI